MNFTNDQLHNFTQNIDIIVDKYQIKKDDPERTTNLDTTIASIAAKLAKIEDVDFDQAMLGICSLLQSGAYLKSVTNRKTTIADKEFDKAGLLKAAEQANCKYTLRVIAKHLRKTIVTVARKNELPGNLYAKFRTENQTHINSIPKEEALELAIYCTDFQLDNPDTPEIVTKFLSNREQNRNQKKNNSK